MVLVQQKRGKNGQKNERYDKPVQHLFVLVILLIAHPAKVFEQEHDEEQD